jgi:AraC-like DNA-binding protein
MILAFCSDPLLRAAVRRSAHPEEDVFLEARVALQALDQGFPRVVVYTPEDSQPLARRLGKLESSVHAVAITHATMRAWDAERRMGSDVPPARVDYATNRLAQLLPGREQPASWVDRALSELARAAGARLPAALRTVGRRVMEFPAHYADLHPLAEVTAMSRGALKARFRRRGLDSPSVYVRWFRALAAAHLLADREVTTLQAAHRLGFTTGGNFCRTIRSVTGLSSTEVRGIHGWNRLLVTYAWRYLNPDALEAWETLDDLFQHAVA